MNWIAHEVGVEMAVAVREGTLVLVGVFVDAGGVPVRVRVGVYISVGLGVLVLVGGVPSAVAVTV